MGARVIGQLALALDGPARAAADITSQDSVMTELLRMLSSGRRVGVAQRIWVTVSASWG